jgi:hypothetical protein
MTQDFVWSGLSVMTSLAVYKLTPYQVQDGNYYLVLVNLESNNVEPNRCLLTSLVC